MDTVVSIVGAALAIAAVVMAGGAALGPSLSTLFKTYAIRLSRIEKKSRGTCRSEGVRKIRIQQYGGTAGTSGKL